MVCGFVVIFECNSIEFDALSKVLWASGSRRKWVCPLVIDLLYCDIWPLNSSWQAWNQEAVETHWTLLQKCHEQNLSPWNIYVSLGWPFVMGPDTRDQCVQPTVAEGSGWSPGYWTHHCRFPGTRYISRFHKNNHLSLKFLSPLNNSVYPFPTPSLGPLPLHISFVPPPPTHTHTPPGYEAIHTWSGCCPQVSHSQGVCWNYPTSPSTCSLLPILPLTILQKLTRNSSQRWH